VDTEQARQGSARLHDTKSVFAFVDMMEISLHFYDPDRDLEAMVDLKKLPGYNGCPPLHAFIMDHGHKVYVGYNGDAKTPSGLCAIKINDIHWHKHSADVEVIRDLVLDNPARPNEFPPVVGSDPRYPFQPWAAQPFTQLHGPALLPRTNDLFWTILTDDRVIRVDTVNDKFLETRCYGENSKFLHGIAFNPCGRRGLGAGYFYDRGFLPAFRVSRKGELRSRGKIWLGTKKNHAAFVHNVEWTSNRWAIVGTMQFARTSLTPEGQNILGPSVWLIDALFGTARQIIGPAKDADSPGVFRSASWVELVGNKLFVGEEDSLDDHFGDDGYVSVFDISNRLHPRFLKRLKPGSDFPADFHTGHALAVTPDNKSVILESYPSGYIARIGVESLKVEHVIKHHMPHGGSIVATTESHQTVSDAGMSRSAAPAKPVYTDELPEDDDDDDDDVDD
jgi:hypothetical protein